MGRTAPGAPNVRRWRIERKCDDSRFTGAPRLAWTLHGADGLYWSRRLSHARADTRPSSPWPCDRQPLLLASTLDGELWLGSAAEGVEGERGRPVTNSRGARD